MHGKRLRQTKGRAAQCDFRRARTVPMAARRASVPAPRRVVNPDASLHDRQLPALRGLPRMLHQVLAPLTRRTEPPGIFMRSGLARRTRLISKTGSSACSRSFRRAAARSHRPFLRYPKDMTWRLAIDVRLRTNDLESRLQAVERMPSEGRGRLSSSSPIVSNSPTNSPKTTSCCSRSTRLCSPKRLDAR